MFLHFEEWSAADLDLFALTKICVRVSGCPYKPRYDYLALFAVGSLVGKAQEVDMAFTRQNSQVRMRVLVTDPKYIPKGIVNHVYDGVGYGIRFRLEGEGNAEKGDVSMQEAGGGDDMEAPSEHPEDALLEDPANNDTNSSNNTPRLADRSGKDSSDGGKQVASEPPCLRVGLIDCVHGNYCSKSAPPKILWGDRDDDESLPSLPPPFNPRSSAVIEVGYLHAITPEGSPYVAKTQMTPSSPSSPAKTELFPVFSAVAGTRGAASSRYAAVTEILPVSFAAAKTPVPAVDATAVVVDGISSAWVFCSHDTSSDEGC
jgi:hypothetical protein